MASNTESGRTQVSIYAVSREGMTVGPRFTRVGPMSMRPGVLQIEARSGDTVEAAIHATRLRAVSSTPMP